MNGSNVTNDPNVKVNTLRCVNPGLTIDQVSEEKEWYEVEATVDSGAEDSVADPSVCPGCPVKGAQPKTKGSISRQRAATLSIIPGKQKEGIVDLLH